MLSKKTQRALKREREAFEHKKAEKEAWAATRDANFQAGRVTLLEHPVWNRATLVTPIRAEQDLFFDNEQSRQTAEDLEGTYILPILSDLFFKFMIMFTCSSVQSMYF